MIYELRTAGDFVDTDIHSQSLVAKLGRSVLKSMNRVMIMEQQRPAMKQLYGEDAQRRWAEVANYQWCYDYVMYFVCAHRRPGRCPCNKHDPGFTCFGLFFQMLTSSLFTGSNSL